MNNTGAKVKISRSLGIPLTPKAARIMERKPHPPGQHGPGRRRPRQLSDYKQQLLEKQRLRAIYNLRERQMRNLFEHARQRKGSTADNLVGMLESRLDTAVLRAGLARTIYAARQYVTHRHMLVNGKRVNIPSYQLRAGDTLAVKPESARLACFTDALASMPTPPTYWSRSEDGLSARLERLPSAREAALPLELALVIEYYSR